MKQLLAILVLCLAAASQVAAQPQGVSAPRDTASFPKVNAVVDSMFDGRMRAASVAFFEGFSPGGSRDIPEAEVARLGQTLDDMPRRDRRARVLIGATDPVRFHRTRQNLTHMFNYTLGIARANYMNNMTGNRATVSTHVILNDRRGVYLVDLERVEDARGVSDHDHPYAALDHAHDFPAEVRFNPHAGVVYLRAGDEDYFSPQVGLGIRKGNFSLFAAYGRTFEDPDDDRIMTSGLRVGQEEGLFFQLGFVDARKLIPHFDEYTARAVGITAGAGFGWRPRPIDITLTGGVGGFNVVTEDELKDEWEFGFT
ncbi:MAG: hypothetical protein ACRDF6_13780, partial [bacterium]